MCQGELQGRRLRGVRLCARTLPRLEHGGQVLHSLIGHLADVAHACHPQNFLNTLVRAIKQIMKTSEQPLN